jgi:serine/threonine-protein kinase
MEDSSVPVVSDQETTLPAGARLGKYEIVRLLGAGGMGSVYEAFHTDIGKHVAVKTLAPAIAATSGSRQRFLREARVTSRLRHSNIVDVTDMGTEGRVAYLVMELLAGEDLAHCLERTGPMPPTELVDIMLPVCSALVAAHQARIVHRDLKPQNIFLANGPRGVEPKVLDFGISKIGDSDVSALTGTGALIGTPHYLAPEQVRDARAASAASDQYSIGVIFYRCLTGTNPFDGESVFAVLQAIVTKAAVPLRERRADLPAGLDGIVERAMRPVPSERFPSVRALGRALLPYASEKARVIWDGAFTVEETPAGAREDANAETAVGSRAKSQARPATEGPLVGSDSLPPTVSENDPSFGRAGAAGRSRVRAVIGALVGAALIVSGLLLLSRIRAPVAHPTSAALSPRPDPATVRSPAPPAQIDQAEAPAERARAQAAATEAKAAETPANTEAEATPAKVAPEAPRRRRSSAPAHRAPPRAEPEAPTAAPPRIRNPNGAPVID